MRAGQYIHVRCNLLVTLTACPIVYVVCLLVLCVCTYLTKLINFQHMPLCICAFAHGHGVGCVLSLSFSLLSVCLSVSLGTYTQCPQSQYLMRPSQPHVATRLGSAGCHATSMHGPLLCARSRRYSLQERKSQNTSCPSPSPDAR